MALDIRATRDGRNTKSQKGKIMSLTAEEETSDAIRHMKSRFRTPVPESARPSHVLLMPVSKLK